MDSVSYQNIKSIVESVQQDGRYLSCRFRCPVTNMTVESRGELQHGELADKLADTAKKSAARGLKWRIASAVRSALGYGILGRAAGDVVSSAMGSAGEETSFSEEERQQAVVEAFARVQSFFFWEGRAQRWMSAQAAGDLLTEFAHLMSIAPVNQPYDRGVLVRMLVEVAAADGEVGDAERALLEGFVTPDQGSVDELARRAPLSVAELAKSSPGQPRETMLMLAWAVALTDQSLDPQELARLSRFAEGLGIIAPRANQLKIFAQKYLVDQALDQAYPNNQRDEAKFNEAMDLAQALGLDVTEAQRVDIRLRKRLGLA